MLRYGSVCSGIEATSVAWETLGWTPTWLSEIEPFPCRVLAHHWPNVPNLGDMTTIAARVRSGEVEAPDVLVGGTPCQSFSLAGLRKGIADPRGQLTFSFGELADVIDQRRAARGQPPCIIVWENVPGVLTSKDNAFGCFLALLAGENNALIPPRNKWPNAGCVFGPQRAAAWRVLDAQFFGVAQRRRRVFVIASARDGFDPASVLFERESVRGNTAPAGTERANGGQGVDVRTESGVLAFPARMSSTQCAATRELAPALCAKNPTAVMVERGVTWWNGDAVSQTLDAVLHKGQMLPEKNRFPVLALGEKLCSPVTATKTETAQIAELTMPSVVVLDQLRKTNLSTTSAQTGRFGRAVLRRLTVTECERLQGFPDGHTNTAGAKDGPRLKAIGNSMAVPVMRWIGERIEDYLEVYS